MFKKMRWRFIGVAMGAFMAVIVVLSWGVNGWNYYITTRQQDAALDLLLETDKGRFDDRGFGDRTVPYGTAEGFRLPPGIFGQFSPEMRHMMRYFTVYYDKDGNLAKVGQDFIASISREDAVSYGERVLQKGKERGYDGNFRYLAASWGQGKVVIFLNAEREIRSVKALLLITAAVDLLGILTVFLLVFFLSGYAIAPYIRNMEIQKRFITDASHELKTPLTSIATSADILAMEHEGDEWVQNIQNQSARLSGLVSNLVALARFDEEEPFFEKSDFSLSDAAWEISEPMGALARAKGKVYEQQIEDGIVVHGDRAAILQVISILLDNAVKYSDEGGRILLQVQKKQRKAKILVFNTCTIQNPGEVNRLFDRFYRPDESRSKQTGGNGIGLSIAKAAVCAHGGKIAAESRDGRDITFTVIL